MLCYFLLYCKATQVYIRIYSVYIRMYVYTYRYMYVYVGGDLVTNLCLTLATPIDCSSPGSSIHGDSPDKNTGMQ